jgi:membrane protease YdiL (CAAX protease family)
MPAILGLALLVVPRIAGVRLSDLGFRPWREWTVAERSYFVQVLCIANLAFPLLLAGSIAKRSSGSGLVWGFATVFVPYLFFGFYQELVYRGLVQVALVSRWGAPLGIGVANVLYTFGPLHFYYFASPLSLSLPMFAAVFAIGLFFGLLYQRSGNLWLVTVFHAIGNAYVVWAFG